jgi:TolA-binding protein
MRRTDVSALRAKLEPPWDDLRERRVLVALLEKRRRQPRRWAWTWALVPALAALVLVVWGVHAWHRATPAAAVAAAPGQSVIALADGSTAVLTAEASVQVEVEAVDRVHLVQSRGSVHYEIRPDPSREFVVRAADTTVRVRGTAFTVDLRDGSVQVDVQRGRVEVTHAGTTRDIVAGESLRLPTDASAAHVESPAPSDVPSAASDASADRGLDNPAVTDIPTAASLEAQADAARLAGDNGQAATTLERLVALHPRDPRVPGALFTLGRVERARGMIGASARAFERCFAVAPGGPLARDAIAEAAQAWSNAGNDDAARQDAAKYLRRWPQGESASQMKAITGK